MRIDVFWAAVLRGLAAPLDTFGESNYRYPHTSEEAALREDMQRIGDSFKSVTAMVDDRYPLIWEIRYAMRYGRLQARLLDRIAFVFKIVTLVAGTGAFIAVIAGNENLVAITGLSVAIISILDSLWDPTRKAAKTRELETRFALLNRDANRMPPEELQRGIDDLYDSEIPEIEALRPVAYNAVLREFGNASSEEFRLTPWQKFLAALA
jgi:hypothetical protein